MSFLDLHLREPETFNDEDRQFYSIIENYLQPRTATTLQSTSAAIHAMLPKNKPNSTEVWTFGNRCIDFAELIPYHHPLQLKLVRLLEYLKLSPHMSQISEGTDLKHHRPTGKFYRHTRFGETMLDNIHNSPDPENPGSWVNFQCFAANLAEHRITSGDPTWAIWALRDAHENVCKEQGEWRQLVREEQMMAAAQWILWFGQGLFKQVLFLGEVDPDDIANSWRPGQLYHGEGGLSLERWHFWRDGFASVRLGAGEEKEGYGEECVRVSRKAAEIMEALEESMTF